VNPEEIPTIEASKSHYVQRRVRPQPEQGEVHEEPELRPLEEFRDLSAWILLGEPGAGKTSAFRTEAELTGAHYLRVDEFLEGLLPDSFNGQEPLYLDGLDEVPASEMNNLIVRLRGSLKRHQNPRFRISCRAVDWYGIPDRDDLIRASPDGKLKILNLYKLEISEIREILLKNHRVLDPENFILTTQAHGLFSLLENPKTLEMLVMSRRDGQLPRSVEEAYRLACETLAEEFNLRHRRNYPPGYPSSRCVEAAGYLCAGLLLSNQHGITIGHEGRGPRFTSTDLLEPPDIEAANFALRSRLFQNEGPNRLVPNHRSVAEYLAALWISKQLDSERVPVGRTLRLLAGADGRAIAGLRGLYGWLGVLSISARERFISTDPLTVITYGDPKSLPAAAKKQLFKSLLKEADRNPTFRWGDKFEGGIGVLCCSDLAQEFEQVLTQKLRNDSSSIHLSIVLDILENGDPLPGFESLLIKIIEDDTCWMSLRKQSIHIWRKWYLNQPIALGLFKKIQEGIVPDHDDELLGVLLGILYPEALDPYELVKCLHPPREFGHLGAYRWFLEYELPKKVPDDHLSILLDGLAASRLELNDEHREFGFTKVLDSLLLRGLHTHAERISIQRLHNWLTLGVDQYGTVIREPSTQASITRWMKEHLDQYFELLGICVMKARQAENPWLGFHLAVAGFEITPPPSNLGFWFFERLQQEFEEPMAMWLLRQALETLWIDLEKSQLSLDQVWDWANKDKTHKGWLEGFLRCEIPELRFTQNAKRRERNQKESKARQDRTEYFSKHIDEIQRGEGSFDLQHRLSMIWNGLFIEVQGGTPLERFENFVANGSELFLAAIEGFQACIHRADLPTAEASLALYSKTAKIYSIQPPCLIGMSLRWDQDPNFLESLPESTLQRMIAYWLTGGIGDYPAWLRNLLTTKPELVSSIYVSYVKSVWQREARYIHWIDRLSSEEFPDQFALLTISELLDSFPNKLGNNLVRHFDAIVRAAICRCPSVLIQTIRQKISQLSKPMDLPQKVTWLTLLMSHSPSIGTHKRLIRTLHRSPELTQQSAELILFLNSRRIESFTLDPKLISSLIELLAPKAALKRQIGVHVYTNGDRIADLTRNLIGCLASSTHASAMDELDRLSKSSTLGDARPLIRMAKEDLLNRTREASFVFQNPKAIATVLLNGNPTSIEDLTTLISEHLDDIELEIRTSNDDGVRAFWNIAPNLPNSPRAENLCRDHLLLRLRSRLSRIGIACDPEADYVKDKRADIRISYRTDFALPIEIKRESHDDLWTALNDQLIPRYTIDPLAKGHGIYIALWFGGDSIKRNPQRRKKPSSPSELKEWLCSQIAIEKRGRVFVKVFDVSLPAQRSDLLNRP
jgi:hypothetical protein